MTTVCLLGCGALARVFAQNLNNVFHGSVTLVGAYCRTPDACRTFAENFGCRAATSLEELLTLNPDYVVEFAGGGAVRTSAETILEKRTSSRRPSVPGRIPTFSIAPKRRQNAAAPDFLFRTVPSAASIFCRPTH